MQPMAAVYGVAFAQSSHCGMLSAMKSVTVQELPQVLGTVLAWLKAGESVELREQDTRVGTILPAEVGTDAARKKREAWLEDLRTTRQEAFGGKLLTPQESAFIRDRGDY